MATPPEKSPGRLSGKTVLVVFFALLVALVAFIFYIGATGGGTSNPH